MADHRTVGGITRVLLPILLALTILELVGGVVLGSFEKTLFRYPTLLVLVPVTIGTAGNLGSMLSARLSTAVHLGTVSFAPTDDRLLGTTITAYLLAGTVFPVVGVAGWLLTHATGTPGLSVGTVVVIAGASGLLLATLAVLLAVAATYVAYRLEYDPDDVVIPVVTNVCDVLGVLVLFAVVRVVAP